MFNKWVAGGAVAAAVAILTTGVASADPTGVTTPPRNSVIGVGGDITEGLFDNLSTDFNTQHPSVFAHHLYSWDHIAADGSDGTITTKAGCTPITRPNGSSAGIAALEARQVLPGGTPCIDFARATRPRLSGDPSNIVFLPFARDGVTWVA